MPGRRRPTRAWRGAEQTPAAGAVRASLVAGHPEGSHGNASTSATPGNTLPPGEE
jgi:hypothetical protein